MKRLLIVTIVWLSSCATLPPLPPLTASQLDSWRLQGRIAISTEQDSWTAKVYWHQQGHFYQLRFNNPMGTGAILLEGDANQVMMRTAENKTFVASDPNTLVAETLHLDIPVNSLHFWIRGLPTPQPPPYYYSLNETQQLSRLHQNGWQIEYKRYVSRQGFILPKKIFLENNQLSIKIVITQWEISHALSPSQPLI